MPFDHAAAATQIAGIIGYTGQPCTLEGRSGTCHVMFDEELSQAQLGDHGTTETIEGHGAFSITEFPEAPAFGAVLTRTADGRRFRVGESYSHMGGWRTTLQVLDLSSVPSFDDYPV